MPIPIWDKVTKTKYCWLWTGYTDKKGYAKSHGRYVHRVVYEQLVGPIPDGLDLDHLCRIHNCVRPTHLEPTTRRQNILRGTGIAAQNARKTHCKRGHEFTPENTRIDKYNRRYCRTCQRTIYQR